MEKQTVAAPVPQLTRTASIPNIGILVSGDNPFSYVRAAGNGSIPSAHPDWQPSLVSLMIGTEVSHNLGIPASVDNDELKSNLFSVHFLIDFYIKRLIYIQEYRITSPNCCTAGNSKESRNCSKRSRMWPSSTDITG